jgi:hypothetical protein
MPFDPTWRQMDYKQYGQIVQQTGNKKLARGYTQKVRRNRRRVGDTPRKRVHRAG